MRKLRKSLLPYGEAGPRPSAGAGPAHPRGEGGAGWRFEANSFLKKSGRGLADKQDGAWPGRRPGANAILEPIRFWIVRDGGLTSADKTGKRSEQDRKPSPAPAHLTRLLPRKLDPSRSPRGGSFLYPPPLDRHRPPERPLGGVTGLSATHIPGGALLPAQRPENRLSVDDRGRARLPTRGNEKAPHRAGLYRDGGRSQRRVSNRLALSCRAASAGTRCSGTFFNRARASARP